MRAPPSVAQSVSNCRPFVFAAGRGTRRAQAEIVHAGEMRLRVLLLPIPTTHRLHKAHPHLTAPPPPPGAKPTAASSPGFGGSAFTGMLGGGGAAMSGGSPASRGGGGGMDSSGGTVSSAGGGGLKVVDARDESDEDRRLLLTMLRNQVAEARAAARAKQGYSQHRSPTEDDDGGAGDDDEQEEGKAAAEGPQGETGLQPAAPASTTAAAATVAAATVAAAVAATPEAAPRPATGRRPRPRWRRGELSLRVEERYGWDLDKDSGPAEGAAAVVASQRLRGRSMFRDAAEAARAEAQLAQEGGGGGDGGGGGGGGGDEEPGAAAVAQLVREQHDLLREGVAGSLWLKPVGWALRNSLSFGACGPTCSEQAAVDVFGSTAHGALVGAHPTHVAQHHALELRRLVLAGPPDTLRVRAGRGAFRHAKGGWLDPDFLPPAATSAAAAAVAAPASALASSPMAVGSEGSGVPFPGSPSRDMLPPAPLAMLRDNSGQSDGPASGESPPPSSAEAARGAVPRPAVLGRLAAKVPRVHVVHDAAEHFASYRIAVTLRPLPVGALGRHAAAAIVAGAHGDDLAPLLSATGQHQAAAAAAAAKGDGWAAAVFGGWGGDKKAPGSPGADSAQAPAPSMKKSPLKKSNMQGGGSGGGGGAPVKWEVLRRFSEFEALITFLTESPKAGTAGPKLKQLVTVAPKSLRSVLKWSMTPEFLEERRASLETALVVLLDALRVPASVCGYRGLSLSNEGQVALLRFLGVPEAFDPAPPPSVFLTRLAATHLRRALFCGGAAGDPLFAYLENDCDDDEDNDGLDGLDGDGAAAVTVAASAGGGAARGAEAAVGERRTQSEGSEDELDPGDPAAAGIAAAAGAAASPALGRLPKGPAGSLHFRSFVWLLVSGALKRLGAGTVFAPFPSFEAMAERLVLVDRAEAADAAQRHTAQQAQNQGSAGRGGDDEGAPLPLAKPPPPPLGSGASAYRHLASAFSQIDLDIWRTKVKPLRRSTAMPPRPNSKASTVAAATAATAVGPTAAPQASLVDVEVDEAAALRRVLRGFVLCKPSCGYCQAMNYVALFLLRASGRFCDERTALALLVVLSEDVVPDYWTPHMTMMQADMQLLSRLVAASLPDLAAHLDAISLPLDLFATQYAGNIHHRGS